MNWRMSKWLNHTKKCLMTGINWLKYTPKQLKNNEMRLYHKVNSNAVAYNSLYASLSIFFFQPNKLYFSMQWQKKSWHVWRSIIYSRKKNVFNDRENRFEFWKKNSMLDKITIKTIDNNEKRTSYWNYIQFFFIQFKKIVYTKAVFAMLNCSILLNRWNIFTCFMAQHVIRASNDIK